jgi:Condensation domain
MERRRAMAKVMIRSFAKDNASPHFALSEYRRLVQFQTLDRFKVHQLATDNASTDLSTGENLDSIVWHKNRISSAQLGLWFAQHLDPQNAAFNVGDYLEILGSIDPAQFEATLRQVILETESLRIRLVERAGEPRQIIVAPAEWSLPFFDVSGEADPTAALSWMSADLQRPTESYGQLKLVRIASAPAPVTSQIVTAITLGIAFLAYLKKSKHPLTN